MSRYDMPMCYQCKKFKKGAFVCSKYPNKISEKILLGKSKCSFFTTKEGVSNGQRKIKNKK